jgi:fibronectin-binding autotransporter adhesin
MKDKACIGWMILALALLAGGEALAATRWWDTSSTDWNSVGSWSTTNNAATPDPGTVPGSADTVIFNIDGNNSAVTARLNADQSVNSMVVRTTGGVTLNANTNGVTARTLTLGSRGLAVAAGGKLFTQGSSSAGAIAIVLGADQTWRNFNNTYSPLAPSSFVIGNVGTADADVDLSARALTLVGDGGIQLGFNGPYGRILATGGGNINLGANGVLGIYNSASSGPNLDRVANTISITSYGGKVDFPISGTTSNYSETVGTLTLSKGALNHVQPQVSASNTLTFTYGGLSHPAGSLATIAFNPAGANGLGDATAYARNMLVITGQADATQLGGWATIGIGSTHGFAAYSTTRGVCITNASTMASGLNDPAGVRSGGATLSADTVVGSLVGSAAQVSINSGKKLTIVSGGLMYGANNAYDSVEGAGTLTAGAAGEASAPLFVWSATPASGGANHNINAVIADNASGSLDLVKSGPGPMNLGGTNTYSGSTVVNEGTLLVNKSTTTSLEAIGDANGVITLTSGDTFGLAPGQSLSGGSFGFGSGRWITSITSSNQFKVNGSAIGTGTVSCATLNGSIASSLTIDVLYGAALDVTYHRTATWTLGSLQTLKGNGTVVAKEFGTNRTIQIDGTVAPGSSAGTLTVTGNVVFANNSILEIEAKNASLGGDKWEPGYDRLTVAGAVDLGSNAKLDVKFLAGETLALGDRLFILDNDGTDAVSGLFKRPAGTVLNEGDAFAVGDKGFKVYYAADTATGALTGGNDVALEVVNPSAAGGRGTMLRVE